MLRHNIISAFRILKKNIIFSIINIFGLSVGLAAFFLISLYVYHELSFDRYNTKADRIFRIVENLRTENELLFQSTSAPPMGPALKREFPEVQSYVRFNNIDGNVRIGEDSYHEDDCYLADSTVFDIFTWPLLKGNKEKVLTEPYSAVITESASKKYFGDKDPLGKTILINGDEVKITGVMKDIPENSHFQVNMLVSFSTWSTSHKRAETEAWFYNGFHTYLLVEKGESVIESLRAKMPDFISRNIEKGGMYYEDLPLQPLTGIYLSTPRSWENGKRGSINNIYILSIIACFILLIACFNYINMATARASRRLKEVALKKVLGAQRKLLISQFFGESLIISFLSALLGLGLAWSFLPYFNRLIEGKLHFSIIFPWYYKAAVLIFLIFLLGILSGIYPALLISGYRPLQIFRPVVKGITGHQHLRKSLVTMQFIISITLVAGTLLVFNQLSLVRNQDLGFNKKATLILPFDFDQYVLKHLESIKNELLQVSGVRSVTASATVPGQSTTNLYTQVEIENGKMSPTNINTNFIDYDYLSAYEIEMLAGRNFSQKNRADDTTAYIINESAMKDFGWTPEEALGKKVDQQGRKGIIIGVTKDYHYRSLHHDIAPLLLEIAPDLSRFSIKIQTDNLRKNVETIGSKWKELAPGVPFRYSFLDEDFDRLYNADTQLGKVTTVFSILSILVGCLGLLGLTSFSVERRIKEIGIRKVLGATIGNILTLISKEFIGLILIAFIIAIPVTWYLIHRWLQNFTSQVSLGPEPFIWAGLSVLCIAMLTVSYLSVHAAMANPAESLRNE